MKPLETDVETPVVEWADRIGILHTKLNLQGRRGWPDRVFWIPGGKPMLIEFKRLGEKPSKLQLYIIGTLERLGYDVRWTDKKEQAISWLKAACAKAARVSKTWG